MPQYQPPRWQPPRKHGLQLPLSRDQLGAIILYPILTLVRNVCARAPCCEMLRLTDEIGGVCNVGRARESLIDCRYKSNRRST